VYILRVAESKEELVGHDVVLTSVSGVEVGPAHRDGCVVDVGQTHARKTWITNKRIIRHENKQE